MKYVFGADITENKNNNMIDGEVFHTNSNIPILEEAFYKCDELTINYKKQISLPVWISVMQYLSLIIACIFACGILESLSDSSLREIYNIVPIFFYIVAVSFTVWLVISILERRKKNQHSDEYRNNMNYIQNIECYAKDLIHIPKEAEEIDVLWFYYKIKKGKMKVIKRCISVDRGFIRYINYPVYVYVKSGTLHMADIYNEWSIPLYSITGIKKVNKKIFVPQWNKEIFYNKGIYKKYKMIRNGLGFVYFKPYYALCITWEDENYELFIPPYELDLLSSLVGLNYNRLYSNKK